MSPSWSGDFSYTYLRRLLLSASRRFDVRTIGKALAPNAGLPVLALRHDVDVSPALAVNVAELEAGLGLRATFFLMVDSPLYSLHDRDARDAIERVLALGHEIGLHATLAEGTGSEPEVGKAVTEAKGRFIEAVGVVPLTVSFHQPPQELLRGGTIVGEMINAYSAPLMASYLSDSGGRWRDGEPLPWLQGPAAPLTQVLTHPIYWGVENMAPEDRLEVIYTQLTEGRSAAEAREVDENLAAATYPACRSGRLEAATP